MEYNLQNLELLHQYSIRITLSLSHSHPLPPPRGLLLLGTPKKAVLDRRILGGCDPALERSVAGTLSANAKSPDDLRHIG